MGKRKEEDRRWRTRETEKGEKKKLMEEKGEERKDHRKKKGRKDGTS